MAEAATEAPIETPQAELPLDPRAVLPRKEPAAPAPAAAPEANPEEVKAETPKEEESAESIAKREAMRLRRKLEKAYKQRGEAEGRYKFLEERLSKIEQPAKVEGEPTLAQFDYDPEKYATAKAEFVKNQTAKELQAKAQEQSTRQYRETLVSKWEDHVDQGAEKYPDWAEVVGDITPDSSFTAAIMDCENAADVAHYLGKNTEIAKKIASMPALSQVREIGKIEAKLLAEPPKAKTPSKAPAPITPLSGTAPVVSDKPLPTDSDEEWIRKRSKQVHGRR